jgi:hypothetical protein|eukprot:XP_024448493.1 UPF0481 protein At3g47200 isoform X3 [Populus trichocarpa]
MMNVAGTSIDQMDSSIDIDKLEVSVQGKLRILRLFSNNCSIYRVPKRLRELNEKAYTPQVISIGPLHYGKPELKEMEEHKILYLKEFLDLSEVGVKGFIAAIAERETRLRNCYAETFDKLSKEEFVEMVLLDCSFLIMFLLKRLNTDIRRLNTDRIFYKPWMKEEIKFDLLLLENQLPFFIVEDLFKLSKILPPGTEYSMIMLTHDLFSSSWGSWVPKDISRGNLSEVEHFVDFLRICQQPAEQPKKLETLTAPSVAELRRAGIKFKLGPSINLLHIKFDDNEGTLEIPHFKIFDHTEILFRNLQAFEQCNCGATTYVCNYIIMLSLLVPDAKDVEILVKEGIIENWLNDNDAVSRLFRNLSKEIILDVENFYFSGVVEDLNKYYRKRGHKWKAFLKQKYFRNPWAIISVVAAAVLVIFTIIQAVCSIIQVA